MRLPIDVLDRCWSAFNGLRLARALAKRDGVDVRVFPYGDAVVAALARRVTPGRRRRPA